MSLLRGIESVVGAYLAIVIIIGSMLAFYSWVSTHTRNINEQVASVLEVTQRVLYPPVLSIKHVNETHVVLETYTYATIKVKDLIVKSLNDSLLYYESMGIQTPPREFVIPRPNEPSVIYLVTEEGLVFHYIPRLDPRLQLAPDFIRNKPYVDEELLNYLSSPSTTKTWSVLEGLGYKVGWGRTSASLMNTTLLKGPVVCALSYRVPCNVNMSLDSSILTRDLNGTSVFRLIDGFLEIVEHSNNYTQIYRVLRFSSGDDLVFRVNLTMRATRSYSGASYAVHFIPVIYVYDSHYDPSSPVSMYHAQSTAFNVYPIPTIRPWLARITLSNITYWNSTSYYTSTFEAKIRPKDLGLSEGYVLVGFEGVVLVTGPESYILRVRIEISR